MGVLQRVADWFVPPIVVTSLGQDAPTQTFATSVPRPVDQLISDMLSTGWGARVGRTEALSVAAVQRGRNELCAVATLPLRLYRGLDVIDSPLLRQINPNVPNVVTLAQTIEDLVFEGISWWRVLGQDFDGYPIVAEHVDIGRVSLQAPAGDQGHTNTTPAGQVAQGIVWLDGHPVATSQMIRFDSPNPGLLRANARAIRRALLLDKLAATYADNPRPLDYFTDRMSSDVDPMAEDEIGPFLSEWNALRKRQATGWIPGNVERVDVSQPSPVDLQLVQLQQQVALEIANGIGVDPEDLGVGTTSRTYFNGVDRRQEKVNRTYAPFMRAITDRLSMGDVTRRGYDVRFDLSDYLKSDPATQVAYWRGLYDMDAMTSAEVRAAAGISGPAPRPKAVTAAPAPAPAASSSLPAGAQFDDRPSLTFSAGEFGAAPAPEVDTESRTITGLALPYGKVASKGGIRYRFKPGSVEYGDVSRVKHLQDHMTPVGSAVALTDGKDGLTAKLSVLSGPEGSATRLQRDQLLYDAENGLYDGLSVGVDFSLYPEDGDVVFNEEDQVFDVVRATLREVSSTPMPAFDDARVTKVAASLTGGSPVEPCAHCTQRHAPGIACATFAAQLRTVPAPATAEAPTVQLSADSVAALATALQPTGPTPVNPAHGTFTVTEPAPYVFDRLGELRRGTHDFSTDLFSGWRPGGGGDEAARQRAETFVRETFAVTPTNVAALNVNVNRPDLYVDQLEYQYPLWSAVQKGTLTDITPFTVPKFSSSSGLVADHVTGTEPTPGAFSATSQTITPTAVSGKVEVTREAYDQGGNPQMSGLIFRQMTRAYYEALEAYAVAQFVASAASIADLTITTAAADSTLDQAITDALVPLQYLRGGDRFRTVFTQIDLYKAMVKAKDSSGRRLYPAVGPQNAVGTVVDGYTAIDAHGKRWLPAWALAATSVNAASSYMFDPDKVAGWATAPQQINLEWRVAWVDIGIWGYKAFAFLDFNGVREFVYDPV
jgi:phage head maturation protease